MNKLYIPLVFKTFPGFDVADFKDYPSEGVAILKLRGRADRDPFCFPCGGEL